MTSTKLNLDINTLPYELRQEVSDFIEFLRSKNHKTISKKREFGYAKGKIKLSNDFDEPLDLFSEYM